MNTDSTSQNAFNAPGDSQAQGLLCAKCSAMLVVDPSVGKESNVRCYRCGDVWARHEVQADLDRKAWRSLWLGVSATLLICVFFALVFLINFRTWTILICIAALLVFCLTGVPAVYTGFNTLLRMRHKRTRKRDRAAAVWGVSLGGIFGVVGGCLVGLCGFGALLGTLSVERTEDPQEITAMMESVLTFETPERFRAVRSQRIMGSQLVVRFGDAEEAEDRNVYMLLMHFAPMMKSGAGGIRMAMRDPPVFLSPENSRLVAEEILEWEMCGATEEIVRKIYEVEPLSIDDPASDSDVEEDTSGAAEADSTEKSEVDPALTADEGAGIMDTVIQYHGYHAGVTGIYGLRIDINGKEAMSEEEARAIFASLGPSESMKKMFPENDEENRR